jgi:iron complex outermembrane recepter protein
MDDPSKGSYAPAALLALGLALMPVPGHAGEEQATLEKLARSSLEELMRVRVTGVTGTPQSRLETPAAVYVITGEDLRRSGHRSLAEALRMVPGMNVGRINSAGWLVGARGLSGSALTATRYLVLVDGRMVYDPLLSTTQWDTVDTSLEDVDRIEVIRGPGATLWGANAMNGVINVITRPASETQGTLLQASLGSQDSDVTIRHGGELDDRSWYRAFAKFGWHGDSELLGTGTSVEDAWSSARLGLRYDRQTDERTLVSVFADAYDHPRASESVLLPVPGENNQFERSTVDGEVNGASLMLRVNRGFGEPAGWRLRAYLDQSRRDGSRFAVSRRSADLDWRGWRQSGRHDWVWGGEALWTTDRTEGSSAVVFDPASRSWSQANLFVQDSITLVDQRLYAMIGSKFTWHEFVGFEVQPNLRLWWTPDEKQTLWASVSRPVRTPSRFEEDGRLTLAYIDIGAVNVPLQVTGDPALRPERLLAWELGYRLQPAARWLLEVSVFDNDYQRLIEPAPGIFGAFTDAGNGRTWGVDVNASAQLSERWRVEGSWSSLRVDVDGPVFAFEERSSPRHLAQLRSYLDIGEHAEFNAAWYHVDEIPQNAIPAYDRLDLGLVWRLGAATRLELWGQNLLEANHPEASGAQVPRSVYARMTVELGH